MNITVYINMDMYEKIERAYVHVHGSKPTEDQIRAFLEADIAAVYYDHVDEGLHDAIEFA